MIKLTEFEHAVYSLVPGRVTRCRGVIGNFLRAGIDVPKAIEATDLEVARALHYLRRIALIKHRSGRSPGWIRTSLEYAYRPGDV